MNFTHFDPLAETILRYSAFRELALLCLDSCYPKGDHKIIIADCILSYDGPLPEKGPLREFAYDFFRSAQLVIECEAKLGSTPLQNWITAWNDKFGADA